MCKTSRNKLKWLGTPADWPKTGPVNTAGAFRLKICIQWCINMWKTIKIWQTYETTIPAPFMCKTSRNQLKWIDTPADHPKTGPENTAGAFRLKMHIRWCINMWKTIKLYFQGRCAGVPSFTNEMVLESLFNKSNPIRFSHIYTPLESDFQSESNETIYIVIGWCLTMLF